MSGKQASENNTQMSNRGNTVYVVCIPVTTNACQSFLKLESGNWLRNKHWACFLLQKKKGETVVLQPIIPIQVDHECYQQIAWLTPQET